MKLHHKIAAFFGYDLIRKKKRHETVSEHLKNLFKVLGINVVIDVGANTGQYGSRLRGIGYTGKIISLEPVSASYQQLRATAEDDSNWQTYQFALGSRNEIKNINITAASVFSSFYAPNTYSQERFKKSVPLVATEEVEIKTLDSQVSLWLEDVETPRVYLKLDTQGFDLEVLDGAKTALNVVQGMQSEISVTPIYDGMPDYLIALGKFESLGFQITGIYPVSRDKQTLAVIEFDCVLRRAQPMA